MGTNTRIDSQKTTRLQINYLSRQSTQCRPYNLELNHASLFIVSQQVVFRTKTFKYLQTFKYSENSLLVL